MEIALYAFCVMYSPGPVNILALNGGLRGNGWTLAGYCVGVGAGMFSAFLVLGYAGEALVRQAVLPYLAAVGSGYILYLAYRLFVAEVSVEQPGRDPRSRLRFREGYFLQILNPKGFVVILPVTTLMFPAAQITGIDVTLSAGLISLGAVGAPASYALLGALAGRRIRAERYFRRFNRAMALMLVVVACSIIYDFFVATPGGPS
ncbi:hypothetical protein KBTX_01637 [wastewater metagenome]|uniref:Cysteine/O-acetylserine efflux protein n=2 Tax=unclassified sequences TaxID=12908 RepID=A0A5B8RF42_9ZZZZ|nr:LysE family transporter [Arhodomonas sp. KWT]QEA05317.1 hypothetical protein KBTEX_01637 [uncultured organism]